MLEKSAVNYMLAYFMMRKTTYYKYTDFQKTKPTSYQVLVRTISESYQQACM